MVLLFALCLVVAFRALYGGITGKELESEAKQTQNYE